MESLLEYIYFMICTVYTSDSRETILNNYLKKRVFISNGFGMSRQIDLNNSYSLKQDEAVSINSLPSLQFQRY